MNKSKFSLNTLYYFIIGIILFLGTSSCNQDDKDPLLGDIRIEVNRNFGDEARYWIYSEAYFSANSYFPPLQSGSIVGNTSVIEVKGVNPGNYVLEFSNGNRFFLQATAGRERKFVVN